VADLYRVYSTCHVNRAADQGDCPIFQDITFKDIVATGAARCGDIAGFKGAIYLRIPAADSSC